MVGTGAWIDGTDEMPYHGPSTLYCEERTEPPRPWREAPGIRVWKPAARAVGKYTPSQLADNAV